MPLENSRGFMLGSQVINDQDKIVSILTKDRGMIKAVAPGALKKKNRFGSMFELFTEVNFFYYSKEGRDLVTLSKGDIINSYFDTVSDSSRVFYFFFIDELIERFIPEKFKAKRLYNLVSSILNSSISGIKPNKLLLYFLIWFLRIEGVMFAPRLCYSCFRRDLVDAWIKIDYSGIICNKCRTDEKILLNNVDLGFIEWSEKNPSEELKVWNNDEMFKKLLAVFKNKAEFHGELKLRSAMYLPEFR